MKKLNLLALALVIGTASVFATTNELLDIPAKQIASQVAGLFENPDFYVDQDLQVKILFTFDSEGKIVVLRVNSTDKDVLNYVRETLSNKTIQTPGELNRVFTMPLKIESR